MTNLRMIYSYCDTSKLPKHIETNALFYPVFVSQNKFFESALFKETYSFESQVEYIGHVAYSYTGKIRPFSFENLVDTFKEYDVIALYHAPHHNIYEFAETWHPGFKKIWSMLIFKLGLGDYESYGVPPAFYCNYWIMRSSIFHKYREFVNKAMDILDTDSELVELCYQDSGYKGTMYFLNQETLLQIAGKPYYTFHPFILERLVCFWVHINGFKTKMIQPTDAYPTDTYVQHDLPSDIYTKNVKKKTIL